MFPYSYADRAVMSFNQGVLSFWGTVPISPTHYVSAWEWPGNKRLTGASRDGGLVVGFPAVDEHFMYYTAQNRESDGTISTSVYRASLCGLPHEELFQEASEGIGTPSVSADFLYVTLPSGVLRIPR